MSTEPEVEYLGDMGGTIEEAAENAAKKVPKDFKNKRMKLTIYAEVTGEHNPIHGYIVALGGGG
jgi:hypothetical protein